MPNTDNQKKQLIVQINRMKDLIEDTEAQLEKRPEDASLKRRLESFKNELNGLRAELNS